MDLADVVISRPAMIIDEFTQIKSNQLKSGQMDVRSITLLPKVPRGSPKLPCSSGVVLCAWIGAGVVAVAGSWEACMRRPAYRGVSSSAHLKPLVQAKPRPHLQAMHRQVP